MALRVDGVWLSPARAYARYGRGLSPGAFRAWLDKGAGWYDGLCDYVFEGCPATRGLDHASQNNLVDLLEDFLSPRKPARADR